jgi:hypothetical protein
MLNLFETFWALYPRRVAKKAAQKIWSRMTQQEQEDCIEALPNHIAYWKLKQTEMDFICHPKTFLSQGRWEDELDMEVKKATKPELPWYSSEDATIKKAQEIGVQAYAGEGWQQWRARISQRIKQLEEQL